MKYTAKFILTMLTAATLTLGFNSASIAAPKAKTYTEDEFLNAFSGKNKKVVTAKLGKPIKTEVSVKPAGASSVIAKVGKEADKSKSVKVEMWYYHNIVKYDAKNTYKETEFTFVNDQVTNIAFFNNH